MKGWDARKLSIASVGLAIVFFLALNVFLSSTFTTAQVDLTEDGLYTLSDGTKEVLATVDEPVTLRLFASKALLDQSPGLDTYAKRVQELLEQYVTLSNGKVSLEVIHPEPFTPSEDRAVGFNIQGIPLDQTGELGYFGLAGTNTTDDRDVIGFLSPQREKFLEYDVTRMINKLAIPKRKTIGLTTGIPIEADPRSNYKPWRVVEIISRAE